MQHTGRIIAASGPEQFAGADVEVAGARGAFLRASRVARVRPSAALRFLHCGQRGPLRRRTPHGAPRQLHARTRRTAAALSRTRQLQGDDAGVM